jgi:hypothetical protein
MIITIVGVVKSVWNWLLASEGLEGYPKLGVERIDEVDVI